VRTDTLTGLPNRRGLLDALARAWTDGLHRAGAGALALVDIESFKRFNHTHGHHAGDELLHQLALRLLHTLPSSVVVARTGADFAVLFPRHSPAEAAAMMEQVAALNAARPLDVEGVARPVRVNVGLTSLQAASVDSVLVQAYEALDRAKANRSGRPQMWSSS
jgi:diguanylate cyclase (GGDEF)-like protein